MAGDLHRILVPLVNICRRHSRAPASKLELQDEGPKERTPEKKIDGKYFVIQSAAWAVVGKRFGTEFGGDGPPPR
jgi:hypothetical protein